MLCSTNSTLILKKSGVYCFSSIRLKQIFLPYFSEEILKTVATWFYQARYLWVMFKWTLVHVPFVLYKDISSCMYSVIQLPKDILLWTRIFLMCLIVCLWMVLHSTYTVNERLQRRSYSIVSRAVTLIKAWCFQ